MPPPNEDEFGSLDVTFQGKDGKIRKLHISGSLIVAIAVCILLMVTCSYR